MIKWLLLATLSLSLFSGAAQAQGAARGPDKKVSEEAQTEATARRELDIARQYFKLKKAYVASLSRAEELVAGYPSFSKRDEALYIAGLSSVYLMEGKGKQKLTAGDIKDRNRTPEQLRSDARDYLTEIVEKFPQSSFREEAAKELAKLGGSNGRSKN